MKRPWPLLLLPAIFLAGSAAVLTDCGTAPYTGRRQLLLLSEAQATALGTQTYQQLLQESPTSRNEAYRSSVQRVGGRIAAVADDPGYAWEFTVIAEDQVNAFALPGGKVAFYEGIMPVCQNDDGVAVVMGHEVAHALAQHGNERVSQGILTDLGTGVVAQVLAGENPQAQQMIAQGLGVGLGVGVTLPFSRKHESEADRIGLILMAKAGYDPREAPRFWQRMASRAGGARPPEFLSTHPHHETRIRQLEEWMPEALRHYRP